MRLGSEAERGEPVTIYVDGRPVRAYTGETVATALLAQGWRFWRRTPKTATWRGLFCNMGICFDCLVTVDGRPYVRACQELVREGMQVKTDRASEASRDRSG